MVLGIRPVLSELRREREMKKEQLFLKLGEESSIKINIQNGFFYNRNWKRIIADWMGRYMHIYACKLKE